MLKSVRPKSRKILNLHRYIAEISCGARKTYKFLDNRAALRRLGKKLKAGETMHVFTANHDWYGSFQKAVLALAFTVGMVAGCVEPARAAVPRLVLAPEVAHAAAKPPPPGGNGLGAKTCKQIPGTKHPATVCVWKTTCSESKGAMGYQHGLMETQDSVDAPGSLIVPAHDEWRDLVQSNCLDLFSFSYGTSWMIRVPGTAAITPPSPTWAEVETKVLPFLENELGLKRPFVGYGQSMGGFNTAAIALNAPKFFDIVMLTHPVITKCGIGDPFVAACLLVSGHFTIIGLPPLEWTVANPINAIKNAKSFPKALVLASTKDEFGLFAGPLAFFNAAIAKGFDVTFQRESGKHTEMNVPAVAGWLKGALAAYKPPVPPVAASPTPGAL